jgi:hypothetical protein
MDFSDRARMAVRLCKFCDANQQVSCNSADLN